MSFDYDVIVPGHRWPTARAFQAAIDADGGTIQLQGIEDWDVPIPVGWDPAHAATLDGQPVYLEVYVTQLRGQTDDDQEELAEYVRAMSEHGVDSSRVEEGAYIFSVVLRHDVEDWETARQLMGALARHFDGYGFDLQTGTSGGVDWADRLDQTLIEAKRAYDHSVRDLVPVALAVDPDADQSEAGRFPSIIARVMRLFRN